MPKVSGTVTLTSALNTQTIHLGVQLTDLEIIVSKRITGDAWNHKSHGYYDGTNQTVVSNMSKGSADKTELTNGMIIRHYEYISSIWTNVFEAKIVSVGATTLTIEKTYGTRCGDYQILLVGSY